jgi:hypothetical protein
VRRYHLEFHVERDLGLFSEATLSVD